LKSVNERALSSVTLDAASRDPVLFLVGPTASGKTSLAMALADQLAVEVVSMDSRQVYRGMDIGTAKPTPAQRARVPHHVIDVVNPDDLFDAARYAELAGDSLRAVVPRGRVPLVVGGTGLYMRALLDGVFRGPGRDENVRRRLRALATGRGTPYLHERLASVDPAMARRVHPNDLRRLVRALEVFELTGHPMSVLWTTAPGHSYRCRPLVTGLSIALDELDKRIAARAQRMIEDGFVDEVKGLLQKGYSPELPSMSAVGYREVAAYLGGAARLEQAVERLIRNTGRYARRQIRWFRADSRVRWLDARDTDAACGQVRRLWERHVMGAQ
jgi:tRNA dimethylallyltransferase